MYNKMKELNDD